MPRRREEFTYRGYKIDEAKAMGISELLPLMPARARRKIYADSPVVKRYCLQRSVKVTRRSELTCAK